MPHRRFSMLHLGTLVGWLLAGSLGAEDWPQFRGAAGGVSHGKDLPTEWGPAKNIRWKVAVPGNGWSSPIVWGSKVFITTAVPAADAPTPDPKKGLYFGGKRPPLDDTIYRWEVHCLSREDGKTLWKKVAAEGKPYTAIQPKDSYASATPLADGERVYAYFGTTGLFAFRADGELAWKKDLGKFKT